MSHVPREIFGEGVNRVNTLMEKATAEDGPLAQPDRDCGVSVLLQKGLGSRHVHLC